MAKKIRTHRDLQVYQSAVAQAMIIFEASKSFPREEMYALTDQIRRSSRSVCSNLTEAWRKRRYEAAFINKVSDAEAEAAETQTWIEFAVKCGYVDRKDGAKWFRAYDAILRTLVGMITNAHKWVLPSSRPTKR